MILEQYNDISNSIDDLNKFLLIKNMLKEYKYSPKKSFLNKYETSFMIFNDLYTGSQFFPIIIQLLDNEQEVKLSKSYSEIEQATKNFNDSIFLLEKMIIKRQFVGKGTRLLTRTINKIKVSNYKDLEKEFTEKHFIPKNYEFKEGLNKSDVYNQKGKDILRGFFWRMELNERKNENNYEIINNLDNKDKLTIEHIMPQTPNSKLKEDLNFNEISEEYEKHLHKLGNLTITANNNIMGNKSFLQKKEIYKKGILEINHKIAEFNNWDFEKINNRTKELSEKAIEIWD